MVVHMPSANDAAMSCTASSGSQSSSSASSGSAAAQCPGLYHCQDRPTGVSARLHLCQTAHVVDQLCDHSLPIKPRSSASRCSRSKKAWKFNPWFSCRADESLRGLLHTTVTHGCEQTLAPPHCQCLQLPIPLPSAAVEPTWMSNTSCSVSMQSRLRNMCPGYRENSST